MFCNFLQDVTQKPMPKAKKCKRDNRVVMYMRVEPDEHARVVKIVEQRGRPHTIASVAAEMFSRGLKNEATSKGAR